MSLKRALAPVGRDVRARMFGDRPVSMFNSPIKTYPNNRNINLMKNAIMLKNGPKATLIEDCFSRDFFEAAQVCKPLVCPGPRSKSGRSPFIERVIALRGEPASNYC